MIANLRKAGGVTKVTPIKGRDFFGKEQQPPAPDSASGEEIKPDAGATPPAEPSPQRGTAEPSITGGVDSPPTWPLPELKQRSGDAPDGNAVPRGESAIGAQQDTDSVPAPVSKQGGVGGGALRGEKPWTVDRPANTAQGEVAPDAGEFVKATPHERIQSFPPVTPSVRERGISFPESYERVLEASQTQLRREAAEPSTPSSIGEWLGEKPAIAGATPASKARSETTGEKAESFMGFFGKRPEPKSVANDGRGPNYGENVQPAGEFSTQSDPGKERPLSKNGFVAGSGREVAAMASRPADRRPRRHGGSVNPQLPAAPTKGGQSVDRKLPPRRPAPAISVAKTKTAPAAAAKSFNRAASAALARAVPPPRRLNPNAVYTHKNYTFETDGVGRVVRVYGTLRLEAAQRSRPNQLAAGRGYGRLTTDVGGHLIAVQFGGPKDAFNLVAMNSKLNGNGKLLGKWGRLEASWARAMKGNPPAEIKVSIECIYKDTSARPSGFRVEVVTNGKREVHKILNRTGG